MADTQVRIVEAHRLDLRDGDRIVVRFPREWDPADALQVATKVSQEFPGHQVIVLCGGVELDVVREGDTSDG